MAWGDIWGAVDPSKSGMNALGWGAGAADLFSLLSKIQGMVQANNQRSQYQQLMNRGPRVSDYYAPMSAAESQAYTRGVGANMQQNIPPQSAAFSDLLGQAMAGRESQRYQDSARLAQADWMNRLQSKSGLYAGAQGQATSGQPGQALSQYLLLRQLMKGRGEPGVTADPSKSGLTYQPNEQDPYSYFSGVTTPGWGTSQFQRPSQFGSIGFTGVNESEPAGTWTGGNY